MNKAGLSHFSLTLTWLAAMLCFLPAILQQDLDLQDVNTNGNNFPLYDALSSTTFEYSLVASISLGILLTLELIIDTFTAGN